MTEQQHPIIPPPELRRLWVQQAQRMDPWDSGLEHVSTQAARWGADQELEACCEWCADGSMVLALELRAARRPKPPSLAEQALTQLQAMEQAGALDCNIDAIRRALERLQELESNG
jgi:hypothetical protein